MTTEISTQTQSSNGRMRYYFAALVLGAALDLGRRFLEPAVGPLGILILPIWAIFYSAMFVALCVLLGLPLHLPFLSRLWHHSPIPAAFLIVVGFACFVFGVLRAHHVYWIEHRGGDEADYWLNTFARLGYIVLLFGVSHWPPRPSPLNTTNVA